MIADKDAFAMTPRVALGALCALLLVLLLYFFCFPKWEYRVVTLAPERQRDRLDKDAFAFTTIKVDQELLARLGGEGWELTAAYLEPETAFPNFGRSEYVVGIQSNVRPQAAVLFFKRRALPWRR